MSSASNGSIVGAESKKNSELICEKNAKTSHITGFCALHAESFIDVKK